MSVLKRTQIIFEIRRAFREYCDLIHELPWIIDEAPRGEEREQTFVLIDDRKQEIRKLLEDLMATYETDVSDAELMGLKSDFKYMHDLMQREVENLLISYDMDDNTAEGGSKEALIPIDEGNNLLDLFAEIDFQFRIMLRSKGSDYNTFYNENKETTLSNGQPPQGATLKKKRGSPKSRFKDCIKSNGDHDKEKAIIERMKRAIVAEKAKTVSYIILSAMKLGYIRKPTFAEFNEAFKQSDGETPLIPVSSFRKWITNDGLKLPDEEWKKYQYRLKI